jgi:phosphohistidine phosphatase
MDHPSASNAPAQRPAAKGRRLSILRHAKATEDEQANGDRQRPLNPRGRDEALKLGAWLKANHTLPDLILCSTALRTRETLAALQVTIPTILTERAYLATTGELLALLQETDDAVRHLLLIGHNPGLHGLVAMMAGAYVREEDEALLLTRLPTCTFVSMCLPAASWKELQPATGELDALAIGSKL